VKTASQVSSGRQAASGFILYHTIQNATKPACRPRDLMQLCLDQYLQIKLMVAPNLHEMPLLLSSAGGKPLLEQHVAVAAIGVG